MIDVIPVPQVLPDSLKNPRAFADHLVFDQDMSAQGIETRGDGPQMNVVKGSNPLHSLDFLDQSLKLDMLRDRLEKNIGSLHDHAISPFEND